MTHNIHDNFSMAYHRLLKDVYESPQFVCSPRGQKIKEVLGYQFIITNPRDRLPFFKARKFQPSYYAAESLWYTAGLSRTDWISNYSAFWNNISDDGLHANSAYGSRIFRPHDRIGAMIDAEWTQWDYVIDELANDNDSRRAVVHIRTAQDSILAKKDVPCTISLQFFLRENALYMVVTMRSSDCAFGIGNDIPAFTLFQEMMALCLTERLGRPISLGDYMHTSHSLHIYEKDFVMVEEMLKTDPSDLVQRPRPMPAMPFTPPTIELVAIEHDIKNSQSSTDIMRVLDRTFIDVYYQDWVYLLAAHRAGKLGDKNYKTQLTLATSYEGYRWFAK